jgi:hypothetical protein
MYLRAAPYYDTKQYRPALNIQENPPEQEILVLLAPGAKTIIEYC